MKIDTFNCPSCGYPLPQNARANQLVKCSACNSTLFISEWTIGETRDAVVVATPTRVYTITDLLAKDDLCNVYRCAFKVEGKEWQGMFRVARDAHDNDLVQNEARTLYHFQATGNYVEFRPFLPLILESFLYQDGSSQPAQQANILSMHEYIASPTELYSLEEIKNYYVNGIDPKDMAWMWRRLLNILGFAHQNGVIHGAVLPPNILIEPNDHKLALTGWSFSVRSSASKSNHLTALSLPYESWYPQEVFAKAPATPGLDLLMAARCMLYLIGADPLGEPNHRNLDSDLQHYFARCLENDPARRPQDAWELLDQFDRVIERLWGPRTFRKFTMPYKS